MRKLLGVFISVLVALGLIFIMDGLIGFWLKYSNFRKANVPDVTLTFETSEFEFQANSSSQGLRNEQILSKKNGVERILALGDSFTWGWGVSDNEPWPKKLENMLQKSVKEIEVINAGVYGTSLHSQVAVCEDYADYLDVDAIIIGLYSTDDLNAELTQEEILDKAFIWRNLKSFFPGFYKLKNRTVQFSNNLEPGKNYNSRFYWPEDAKKIIKNHPNIGEKVDPKVFENFKNGLVNPAMIENAVTNPDVLNTMLDEDKLDRALEAVGTQFGLLRNCANGRPVYILFIPSEEMVSSEYQESRKLVGYKPDERLLEVNLDVALSEVSKKFGFTYISPLNEFRKDGCVGCYFPIDSHFTPLGHLRLAEYIYQRLN